MSLRDRVAHLATLLKFSEKTVTPTNDYARGVHDGLATAAHIIEGREGDPPMLGSGHEDQDDAERATT